MARVGYDGEMVSMAQNGIEKVTIADKPEDVPTPPSSMSVTAPASIFGNEDAIKSPTGVKNQQESTFSISGNNQRTSILYSNIHLY